MIAIKDWLKCFFMLILVISVTTLIFAGSINAAYWTALPPYNILWPLWSPPLSPPDPLTGQPIPLLTHLDMYTMLPVQPGLVMDPYLSEPYALYNNPLVYSGGLLYFNETFGFGNWPPSYLRNPLTGIPLPLSLPYGYANLPPTDQSYMEYFIPLANNMYSARYGTPLTYLLTAAQLLGIY